MTLRTHAKQDCHPPCPVHAPSDHPMREWPKVWRPDRGIFERTCAHPERGGCGHPDPDTLAYIRRMYGEKAADTAGVHGCDGCCRYTKDGI